MNWILLAEIVYVMIIIAVLLRIIYDTQTVTKTLAYLLLVIFVPLIGIFIYFSFGINYRKNKLYNKKIVQDQQQEDQVLAKLESYNLKNLEGVKEDNHFAGLMKMIYQTDRSPLTTNNSAELLINGEEKFPAVLEALRNAKHHIHIEYYIYEDDEIGRAIEQILIEKARSGVEVRFIYDDFGSASIRKTLAKRLRENGVKAFPFYRIKLIKLASRLNYRNHRKIIVIDGRISFIGGINISDKYSNASKGNKLYWRDTHLKLEGDANAILQHIFIGDWNYCSDEKLTIDELYFPKPEQNLEHTKNVQIVSSGPDSDRPSIYYAIVKAIQSAKKEIFLTTPYFIPGETIIDAMKMASLSGVNVKLLVPGISDSFMVNAAAKSYYTILLRAGVQIYLYQKGFVHAKTLVADRCLAMVGTANLDYRSFDLNFEVNAVVYDEELAGELTDNFEKDLLDSEQIDIESWLNRPKHIQLIEKIARLMSPML
ncbi:cardiolipin synthase [Kaistella flava (ex Peng et al. 2021)]|uniref:Cardiolipin synthase n=1 Tax=Kaistella flava (ex Peng et al. 2021) TaxID=2038776 RepID=A0A7M2YA23_9FLAO|nr:cardiolipin synthase [Kaistella flava (ex Peng et al. 2021)]QOW11128.1 cardiolipin synthase [Kaistella flava (ex Peng et al. 2021)]